MENIECRIKPPFDKFIETFLRENGKKMDNKPKNVYFVPSEKVLVCLTDNTVFQNAFVVFSPVILEHFLDETNRSLKSWFILPDKLVKDHSDWDGHKMYS